MKPGLFFLIAATVAAVDCKSPAGSPNRGEETAPKPAAQAKQIALEVDGEADGVNPSDEKLRAMLLAQSDTPDSFFILSGSSLVYLQGAVGEEGKFHLEYQEGSLARHFEAEGSFSLEETLPILSSYVRGDDGWRKACTWKKLDL